MTASPASVLTPVIPDQRIESLDALRAVALFGVLLVNLLTEFRVSIFEQFLGEASGSRMDHVIDHVVRVGIESKAFILFSFLFGSGLAIQFDRARRSARPFLPYSVRRLGTLLVIGILHLTLIWNGDILTEYAVAGFLGLPLLYCRRSLLPIALLLFAVFVAPVSYPGWFGSRELMRAHIDAANVIYAHGDFAAVEAFRLHELAPILTLLLGALPRTLGLFALGIWAFRSGVFERGGDRAGLLRATALFGSVIGGAGTLITAGTFGSVPFNGFWGLVIASAADIALALGYAALLLLASEYAAAARLLALLVPLGRMALTNYLLQSVILGFVFYGYGLGLFGKLSVTPSAILGITLYALQALASGWWLTRFRFGPVEWLWRCATYGAWQQFRLRVSG